ncbi:sodium:proton antiporter [Clostridium carboxidivorans P7]|uniref:Na+/H+ antiporter NhaC n=1 Tax=Clostridium carboxidivorans P7 TaxID=536227 RepID=C6PS57_9CLOT|nr:Na+/H+ antiporter NhaC family protein [Clostridium carboxidivorans]AKN31895.1 sodium:proton antiporter [Clostridium carboxidivorans P7]EET87982.1 Na+/H+ antiporter NhaC [Clostridium carboxidivorans P7]
MEIYIGLIVSFFLIIFSVLENIFIGYILIVCWILFAVIALKNGYTLSKIGKMSFDGGKQSFVVLKIFILIGAIIGSWMASGTIPSIIYYCLKYINPSTFVLSTFIICCITSFLIGTSLGTVSTVGIPLMIIARSGHINLNLIAGAIIAGAYFGDRCSPMSSSAYLVANLTKTDIYTNIKNMIRSSIIPFILSLIFYYIFSVSQPLKVVNNNLSAELLKSFNINFIMLLPAAIILILVLCKVKISISILISTLSASVLAIFFQSYQLKELIYFIIFGFKIANHNTLQSIIKGGGIISMLKPSLVIFVSCSLAGIFEGIKIFDKVKNLFSRLSVSKHKLFGITSIVSILTAAFGCNQSIATVMTNKIMEDCYNTTSKYQFALDLENSGILISALIPWNIAALVPTTTMNVSATGYLPYAFYLYILPIIYFTYSKYSNKNKIKCSCINNCKC